MMPTTVRTLLLCLALLVAGRALAEPRTEPVRIELKAILGDKAMLQIDGRQVMLAPDQSVGGVRLQEITAGRESVRISIDGESQVVGFGQSVTSAFSVPELAETRVYRDAMGMYAAVGSINGLPVRFLLDTGATFVGLDAATARRAGIRYRLDGQAETVQTAAGPARAWRVKLDSVSLGAITVRFVDAHVIEKFSLDRPLLGMSFLGRLQVRNEAGAMVLEQRR